MTVNITDFGSRTTDIVQTDIIQRAIDECFLGGGGTVIIPQGIYRVGGLRLRSHVTLHLMSGAMLEGSENPEDYLTFLDDKIEPIQVDPNDTRRRSAIPTSRWNNGIIRAIDAEDISIIGEPYSYIDGRNCYDEIGEEKYRGPHAINLQNCKNVRLGGYTIRNSANWAHNIVMSSDVKINNVTVFGGHDGIDLMLCEDVEIHGCRLETGDDCIAGFGSKDVVITDCLLNSSCSAVRFGGTDVLFERCKTTPNPSFGFRGSLDRESRAKSLMTDKSSLHRTTNAFLYYCDLRFGELPYKPGNIVYRDCDFDGIECLFYMTFGNCVWCTGHPLTSIRFENCRAKGLKRPIYIWGDSDEPIDFTLDGVTLSAAEGTAQTNVIEANNFKSLSIRNSKFIGYDEPKIVTYCDGKVDIEGSTDVEVVCETAVPEQRRGM